MFGSCSNYNVSIFSMASDSVGQIKWLTDATIAYQTHPLFLVFINNTYNTLPGKLTIKRHSPSILYISACLAMPTNVLKALPGELDIKRHSPSILYISASLAMSTSVLKALPGKHDIKRHSRSILYISASLAMINFVRQSLSISRHVHKIENYVIITSLKSETMGKLINRIPGSRLLISSITRSA